MSRQERETNVRTVTGRDGSDTTTQTEVVSETQRQTRVENPVTWEEMRTLLRREPALTERTWRPTTGGILEILAGAWNLILGAGAVVGGTSFFPTLLPSLNVTTGGLDTATTGAGIFFIVIGIVSIIGGIMAVSRRVWGLALAGAIVALFPTPLIFPFIFGILALIFVSLGHLEFRGTSVHDATK